MIPRSCVSDQTVGKLLVVRAAMPSVSARCVRGRVRTMLKPKAGMHSFYTRETCANRPVFKFGVQDGEGEAIAKRNNLCWKSPPDRTGKLLAGAIVRIIRDETGGGCQSGGNHSVPRLHRRAHAGLSTLTMTGCLPELSLAIARAEIVAGRNHLSCVRPLLDLVYTSTSYMKGTPALSCL